MRSASFFLALTLSVAVLGVPPAVSREPRMPAGFRALFNGKDLTGWHGRGHVDPRSVWALSATAQEAEPSKDREEFEKHWTVENGELVNDGDGAYATTDEEFGDIELRIEYRTVAKADSGIYLRGNPQVQIWDTTEAGGKWDRGAAIGLGRPLEQLARRARARIRSSRPTSPSASGTRCASSRSASARWVWLNDKPVVDGARMENYWDRALPLLAQRADPAPDARRRDPLAEHHGPRIAPDEANRSGSRSATRRASRRSSTARTGPAGPDRRRTTRSWTARITCKPGKGGTIFTKRGVRRLRRAAGVQAPARRQQRPGDPLSGRRRRRLRRDVRDADARRRRPEVRARSIRGRPRVRLRDGRRPRAATCGRVGEWNFEEVTVEGLDASPSS